MAWLPKGSLATHPCGFEITYCLGIPKKAAERFAARFAAKEAFYKAIAPLAEQPLRF